MSDALPPWAQRLRREREAREWSLRTAAQAMQAHAGDEHTDLDTPRRNLIRWEKGSHYPDSHNRAVLAATYGTVTSALFPDEPAGSDTGTSLITATGMDAMELLGRLQASDVDAPMLDALRFTVDRLCSDYPFAEPDTLHTETLEWLKRINGLRDGRLTLSQHREVLALAGWLALLASCLEHDMTDPQTAEATRRAALTIGHEADVAGITGWAHEIRAWIALTHGDFRGVIRASEAGQAAAQHQGVAVQLAGQRAKAWARLGDRRQVEVALDQGRRLLESLPYPDDITNHFTVDPAKFDFYAMDCYRTLHEDRRAQTLADEVIRAGNRSAGQHGAPMQRE